AEAKKTITKVCKSIDDAIVKPEAKHRNLSRSYHLQNQTSAGTERAIVIDPTDGPLYLKSNASGTKVISKKVVALIVLATIMVLVFSGESGKQRNPARHKEPATQQDVLSAQQAANFEVNDNETAPAKQLEVPGTQQVIAMSANLRASLQGPLADMAVTRTAFNNADEERAWLSDMSRRLSMYMPDEAERFKFLKTLHWEASRAGVDPQLMLGLIEIESKFRKFYVSPRGARGYMQVMPYWVEKIGTPDHNLFELRTNLRYGALILRHYIDFERGDLFLALGHYDSGGRPGYPNLVVGAWK
ncbi:MAG: transglycosylase SLT domain-containing protein, partial [Anaerolineales bacterium]